MKQYVIDELRPEDYEQLKAYLDEHYGPSRIGGIYWIPFEEEYLSEIQIEHKDCQPFYFAVDLESNRIACELLVRTQKKVRCDCIRYATQLQRNRIIHIIDAILEKLSIIV